MSALAPVGLVGLGAMGRGIAANLLAKGYGLLAYDVRPEMQAWTEAQGGRFASDLAQIGRTCKIVISFVVNDAQTEAITFGLGGLSQSMAQDSVLVTCSTMPPSYVQALAQRLSAQGIHLIDAPVTGGAAGAAKGTLTVMAAGPQSIFERVRPVLETFSARLYHLSEVAGAGAQLKVINQLLCGVHLAAAGEALALAQRQGLPLDLTLEVLRSGAASSWMLGDRGPRMAAQAWDDVTSAIDIFVKDTALVLAAAQDAGFDAALARVAHQAFKAVSARGLGGQDDSAVMLHYTPNENAPPKKPK
ncbi:MAG: hypothetical protein RL522_5 [Pseudomonadota bacterium]|jgi:3-hydroxyisobutyrate dehydrogenase